MKARTNLMGALVGLLMVAYSLLYESVEQGSVMCYYLAFELALFARRNGKLILSRVIVFLGLVPSLIIAYNARFEPKLVAVFLGLSLLYLLIYWVYSRDE